jgi:hypothetical protein
MPGIKGTMEEFKAGELHSGSKQGPEVKSRAQAIAIGLSEERKEGHAGPPAPKSHGYGHDVTKRKGPLRTSGHHGAHRIGKK